MKSVFSVDLLSGVVFKLIGGGVEAKMEEVVQRSSFLLASSSSALE